MNDACALSVVIPQPLIGEVLPATPPGFLRLQGELEIRPNRNFLRNGTSKGNRPWYISGIDLDGKPIDITATEVVFLATPRMVFGDIQPGIGCGASPNRGQVAVIATDIAISRQRDY